MQGWVASQGPEYQFWVDSSLGSLSPYKFLWVAWIKSQQDLGASTFSQHKDQHPKPSSYKIQTSIICQRWVCGSNELHVSQVVEDCFLR